MWLPPECEPVPHLPLFALPHLASQDQLCICCHIAKDVVAMVMSWLKPGEDWWHAVLGCLGVCVCVWVCVWCTRMRVLMKGIKQGSWLDTKEVDVGILKSKIDNSWRAYRATESSEALGKLGKNKEVLDSSMWLGEWKIDSECELLV